MPITQTPYPIDALPDIIKNAITAYAEYGQQPLSLLANSALSNISLACQGLANVARDNLLVSPISMYFITVASSGERKTAADKVFSQGISAWEEAAKASILPSYHYQRNVYLTWSIKRKAILTTIKRLATQEHDTSKQEAAYHAIMMQQPDIPLLPKLKYEDITAEALSENLTKTWPSASIFSDEGGIVLSSPSMQKDATKYVALFNKLWDAQPLSIHRKTTNDVFIRDRRFTLNLMLQPLLLQQMLDKQQNIHRHSGFLARTLLAYPESNMGTRFYKKPINHVTEAITTFHDRIRRCLDDTLPIDSTGFKGITTLSFSTEGKAVWVKYFNEIEKAIANPYQWQSISDLASKASENIARLAALFHVFTDANGTEISANHIENSYQIVSWHLNEAKRIFGESSLSQIECDAQLILKNIAAKNITQTTLRDINRITSIRDTKRRDNAIDWLEQSGFLTKHVEGKSIVLVFNNSTQEMKTSYA